MVTAMTLSLDHDQAREQQRRIRVVQEWYDTALASVGFRAPDVVLGETYKQYDCGVLTNLQNALPRVHSLAKFDIRDCPRDIRENFRPQIVKAYLAERANPSDLEEGELRPDVRRDHAGNIQEIRWHGRESFVKAMGRPGRKVVGGTNGIWRNAETLVRMGASNVPR
jgi:hypothetical protein